MDGSTNYNHYIPRFTNYTHSLIWRLGRKKRRIEILVFKSWRKKKERKNETKIKRSRGESNLRSGWLRYRFTPGVGIVLNSATLLELAVAGFCDWMHLFYFSGFSGCTLAWQVSFPASEHCCVFKSVPLPCREPLGGRTPCSQRVLLFGRWAVGEGGMLAIVSDLTRIGQAGLCSIRGVFWRWLGGRGRGGGLLPGSSACLLSASVAPSLRPCWFPPVWRNLLFLSLFLSSLSSLS